MDQTSPRPPVKRRAPRPVRGAAARPNTRRAALDTVNAAVLEEARLGGLLDGEKSEHVSFRAPPALIEAAKRATRIASTTELGILALAMLARKDPFVAFMERTRGRLGKDHKLDY